jgi:hypothetical protein
MESPKVQAREIRSARENGSKYGTWAVTCPYCSKEHFHGAGEGHRATDCVSEGSSKGYFLVSPEAK